MADAPMEIGAATHTPWAVVGMQPNKKPIEQLLREIGLDWRLEFRIPEPITFKNRTYHPSHGMIIRDSDGEKFGEVPVNTEIHQNEEILAYVKAFMSAGKMKFDRAGSFDNGTVVWALGKVPDRTITLKDGDVIEPYLLFMVPHTYGQSPSIRLVAMRELNKSFVTFFLPEKSTREQPFKLTLDKKELKDEVDKIYDLVDRKMATYERMAKTLMAKRYTEATLDEYLSVVFPNMGKEAGKSRAAVQVMDYIEATSIGAGVAPHSWWNAFQAYCYMRDHVLGHTDETRLKSAWNGPNRGNKLDALQEAWEFARKA